MAKVMETNDPQTIAHQQLSKGIAQIIWLDSVSHLINENVAYVVRIIAPAAQPAIFLLLSLLGSNQGREFEVKLTIK